MADKNLESWIENQLKQGYDLEDIEEVAREQGWAEDKIKEAENLAKQKVGRDEDSNSSPIQDNYAGTGMRILAYFIDWVSIFVISFVFGFALSIVSLILTILLGTSSLAAAGASALYAFTLVTPLIYFIVLESRYGRTLGKKILDLKVVKVDGGDIGMKESSIRNLLRVVDEAVSLFLIGIISIMISDRSQRVGDRVAGTVVIKEK